MICIRLFLGLFFNTSQIIFKTFSPDVSRAELIPNVTIFRQNTIVYCWLFGDFIVKYEIGFFTRVNFIEGYISNSYIDVDVTYFSFQLNIPISTLPVIL